MNTIELVGVPRTGLYPRTRKQVSDLHQAIRDKLTPWRFFNTGKPVKVTNFAGKQITYEGIEFEGSPRVVFWESFIEPFLENGIVNVLQNTLNECQQANLQPEEYIEEAANLLKIFVRKIYAEMAEIDQKIRGKGFPNSVQRRIVDGQIAHMERYINEHKSALMLLSSPHNKPTTPSNLPPSTTSSQKPKSEDLIELKPSFFGIVLNGNEAFRRIRKWWRQKKI